MEISSDAVHSKIMEMGLSYYKENLGKKGFFSANLKGFFDQNRARLVNAPQSMVEAFDEMSMYIYGNIGFIRHLLTSIKDRKQWAPLLRGMADVKVSQHTQALKAQQGISLSCRKGCSACCHQKVEVGIEEVYDIAERIQNGTLAVDEDVLAKQASWADDEWISKWREAKCVFLGQSGECRIYEQRPLACRVVMAISDPKDCVVDDRTDPVKPVITIAVEADAALTALYNESEHVTTLPKAIQRVLKT